MKNCTENQQQRATAFFIKSLEQLKDVRKCDKAGCPCNGVYHCQFCYLDHFKPAKPGRVLKHLLGHWGQRVPYKDHFIVKCHNSSACLRRAPHYHCPRCTQTIYRKQKFEEHLKLHDKKDTDASAAVESGAGSHEQMELSSALVENSSSPENMELSLTTVEVRTVSQENKQKTPLYVKRRHISQANEITLSTKKKKTDSQSCKRFYVKSLDELKNVEKCTQIGCTCNGQQYHCQFCDLGCFKAAKKGRVKSHLMSHWAQRVPYKDHFIVKCHNLKTCFKSHPHYHCPECTARPQRKKDFEEHVSKHGKKKILNTELTGLDSPLLSSFNNKNNQLDEIVLATSVISKQNLSSDKNYCAFQTKEQTLSPEKNYCASQPKERFYIRSLEQLKDVQKCTEIGCPCNGKYHCQFCDLDYYKPAKRCRVISHLMTHWAQRVPYKDHFIVKCHNLKKCFKTTRHYHCPKCNVKPSLRKSFEDHLSNHGNKEMIDSELAELDSPLWSPGSTSANDHFDEIEIATSDISKATPSPLTCFPLRLQPGQEIRESLTQFVDRQNLKGAFIMTCVGSVTMATLRMADSLTIRFFEGPFEIVSLVGTLSGGGHLHTSLSDKHGNVIGGHVVGDMVVHTTAEIVIGHCGGVVFTREPDATTGYNELVIRKT